MGINIGPAFGPSRTGDFTVNGHGSSSRPLAGGATWNSRRAGAGRIHVLSRPSGRPVRHRLGRPRGVTCRPAHSRSFKYLSFKGNTRTAAAWARPRSWWIASSATAASVCSARRVSRTTAVLNSVALTPGVYLQTYAQVVNQYGVNYLFGVWGDATIQGNVGYLRRQIQGKHSTPGAELKLTQPIEPARGVHGRSRLQPDIDRCPR